MSSSRGGAQNIGAGIAKTLAAAGANVMIADLQGDKAQETARQIEAETGGRCIGMGCDVTKAEDIDALVQATVDAFGGISTLVNNVGWGPRHDDPRAITEDELVDAYKLNTISAYRMSMACLPHLEKAENASITNSGSFSSAVPAYDILGYGTAKAALNQMMISLAHTAIVKNCLPHIGKVFRAFWMMPRPFPPDPRHMSCQHPLRTASRISD